MDLLSAGLGVGEDRFDLGIVEDRAVFASAVDLHQILIDDTSGTDIEVPYFGVTHLSVGQTDVLAACLELRVRVFG